MLAGAACLLASTAQAHHEHECSESSTSGGGGVNGCAYYGRDRDYRIGTGSLSDLFRCNRSVYPGDEGHAEWVASEKRDNEAHIRGFYPFTDLWGDHYWIYGRVEILLLQEPQQLRNEKLRWDTDVKATWLTCKNGSPGNPTDAALDWILDFEHRLLPRIGSRAPNRKPRPVSVAQPSAVQPPAVQPEDEADVGIPITEFTLTNVPLMSVPAHQIGESVPHFEYSFLSHATPFCIMFDAPLEQLPLLEGYTMGAPITVQLNTGHYRACAGYGPNLAPHFAGCHRPLVAYNSRYDADRNHRLLLPAHEIESAAICIEKVSHADEDQPWAMKMFVTQFIPMTATDRRNYPNMALAVDYVTANPGVETGVAVRALAVDLGEDEAGGAVRGAIQRRFIRAEFRGEGNYHLYVDVDGASG